MKLKRYNRYPDAKTNGPQIAFVSTTEIFQHSDEKDYVILRDGAGMILGFQEVDSFDDNYAPTKEFINTNVEFPDPDPFNRVNSTRN